MKISSVGSPLLSSPCSSNKTLNKERSCIKTPVIKETIKNILQDKHVTWIFKNIAKTGIESFRWCGYLGFLGVGLIATVEGNKILNTIAQDILHIAPKPSNNKPTSNFEIDGHRYDAFFANHKDFNDIINTMKKVGIDHDELDINKDGIRLNDVEEIQKLKQRLTTEQIKTTDDKTRADITSAIKKLNKIDILNKLIFGKYGIDSESFYQGELPNCQIMAAIKGLSFTQENMQELKSMIKVTSYSLDKKNLHIDTVVNIDGTDVYIPFSKLLQWVSPKDFDSSYSTDGSLLVPILASAIQEVVEEYDRVPNIVPSSSPILATGKDYLAMATVALSDEDLKEILSQAPQKLITVGTYIDVSSLDEAVKRLADELAERFKKRNSPVISEEKLNNFTDMLNETIQELTPSGLPNDKNELQSISQNNPKRNTFQSKRNFLIGSFSNNQEETVPTPNHMYAVKNYYVNAEGESIVTITDSYGAEYHPLNLEEFRKHIFVVVVPKEHVPLTNTKSLTIGLLSIIGAVLARKGAYKLNKLLNPEYKSLIEKLTFNSIKDAKAP